MGKFVDKFEERIQNTTLTTINITIIPSIELGVRSKNASSGRDTSSVTTNAEREDRIGIIASSENVSETSKMFHEINAKDETRGNIPYKVSELSAPWTHFKRQCHTHHDVCIVFLIIFHFL